jgi:hypothetical protein
MQETQQKNDIKNNMSEAKKSPLISIKTYIAQAYNQEDEMTPQKFKNYLTKIDVTVVQTAGGILAFSFEEFLAKEALWVKNYKTMATKKKTKGEKSLSNALQAETARNAALQAAVYEHVK